MRTRTEDADNQEQEVSCEEYHTDRYEQERFTDAYTEDFRDDYDNVDRFTDDNAYRENFTHVYTPQNLYILYDNKVLILKQ